MDKNHQDEAEQQQTWWQKNKQLLVIIGIVIIVLLIVSALAVNRFGWDWTGFSGGYNKITKSATGTITSQEQQPAKTLWDWMQLLLVPTMLAIGVFWLNQIQKSREEKAARQRTEDEQKIATDNQRETALQTYFDRMSELLLHEELRKSQSENEVRQIARVRTLTVLSHLDKVRKRKVLQFLQESGLIDDRNHLFSFGGAEIDHADLRWLHLEHAHLNGALGGEADFREAHLQGANLQGAHFDKADFSGANLNQANLSEAHFPEAKFIGADLTGAILNKANLRGAKYNTKTIQETDFQGKPITNALGNPVMIGPTQWPQGFDPKIAGSTCLDC